MSDINYNNCNDETKIKLINARLRVINPLLTNIGMVSNISNVILTQVFWSQVEKLRDELDEILKSRTID